MTSPACMSAESRETELVVLQDHDAPTGAGTFVAPQLAVEWPSFVTRQASSPRARGAGDAGR